MSRRSIDHDRFVRNNAALAKADAKDKLDEHGPKDSAGNTIKKTCNNCNRKKHCKKNKITTISGTASFGSEDIINNLCVDWTETKSGIISDKQRKNLLKSFIKKMR